MNKKNLIPAFTVLLAGWWLASCEPKQVVYTNNLWFDTITVTQTHYLKNDSTQPSCNLRIRLVYPANGDNARSLKSLQKTFVAKFFGESYAGLDVRDAIARYTANYISNYEKDAEIFFNDREKNISEEGYPDDYFSYYETLSSDVTFNRAGLFAFCVQKTNFKADRTNSFRQISNYVYDLRTDCLLTEDSLFADGYEKILNIIFKAKLLEANAVETVEQLERLGYFGVDELMPNGNFLVDEKGITYTFNKGEYSALLLDEITIFIPKEELAPLLKENSPLSAIYTD
ncbi:MAG: RsiV family protein [Prevotella sp.]|nr:RsiV family protein [Prevotella sp.]